MAFRVAAAASSYRFPWRFSGREIRRVHAVWIDPDMKTGRAAGSQACHPVLLIPSSFDEDSFTMRHRGALLRMEQGRIGFR
jgi:hypothetical protein